LSEFAFETMALYLLTNVLPIVCILASRKAKIQVIATFSSKLWSLQGIVVFWVKSTRMNLCCSL